MNCQEYLSLDQKGQITLIGRVVHLLQSDSESFQAFSSMVRSADQQGKFDKVKFGDETFKKQCK